AAFGTAVAMPLSSTGVGVTVGSSVGAVASRLIVTVSDAVPPALLAVQVSVTPSVSAVMVAASQPSSIVTADSSSVTVHVTVTSLVYQPSLPSVPVIVGVMTGGVASLRSAGTSSLPYALSPQQTIVPLLRRAQVWSYPALTCVKPASAGMLLSWRNVLSPQQTIVPPLRRAQVWSYPAL